MINLLLISEDTGASATVGRLTGREAFRVTSRRSPEEAAGALSAGVFDVCVLYAERCDAAVLGRLQGLRRLSESVPVLVLAGAETSAAERAAPYAAGADVVAQLPLEPEAFAAIAARLVRPGRAVAPAPVQAPHDAETRPATHGGMPALGVLRDFSRVLGYSLDERQFITHFLQKLREIVGVNRIAVFVEPPPAPGAPALRGGQRSSRLAGAGSIGVPQDIVECFELSLTHGIGKRVAHSGQVLRLRPESPLAGPAEDPRVVREFEILGGQIAIPVSDRERCVGVAVLGGKLTGERFASEELELLCHLMEELGLALKNSRLHAQLAGNHRLFSDVLEASTSGLLVVGPDLELVHANRAAREFLGRAKDAATAVVFADLPPKLAGAVHEFVQQGGVAAPFLTELPGRAAQVFRVSLLPFARETRPLPQPVLAVIEDFTSIEAAKRAEIDSANLKLTATIARRFAHEIRNSLVPLTTHQQLFDAEYASEEFRQSLKNALTVETGRIQRFTEQMLFLSHAQNPPADIGPVEALLREAFGQAQAILGKTAQLEFSGPKDPPLVRFHRPSLLHAFKEIFLNAIQSSGAAAVVRVRLDLVERDGDTRLTVAFRDSGPGFPSAVLPRAAEPFYTTRNTGVGLGLTVARKVVEDHRGRLELFERTVGAAATAADVVLTFPQDF